jgi:hypothetical protein
MIRIRAYDPKEKKKKNQNNRIHKTPKFNSESLGLGKLREKGI